MCSSLEDMSSFFVEAMRLKAAADCCIVASWLLRAQKRKKACRAGILGKDKWL